MEWIADPAAWLGLGTLILLEVVLGIDNLIFIAILVDRLPPHQRDQARIIGLVLALVMRIAMLFGITWLQSLRTPIVHLFGSDITVRGLILIAGGAFLLVKATVELHSRLERTEPSHPSTRSRVALWQTIAQIVVIDAVFSIDSVVTAVGLVDQLSVMIIAVIVAIAAMMFLSGPLTRFVSAHPSVVILCLSFLLTIGFSLFAEGFGFTIPKGYLYSAIALSVMIEALNQIAQHNQVKHASTSDLRSRTADAVLRLLGGPSAGPENRDLPTILAAGGAADVFAPSEREMVKEVLSMAVRPARSIMTPSAEVTWLNLSEDAASLSRKILQTGHAAYPVCRERFGNLLGVARAPDLVGDLLGKGRISEQDLETPLHFYEDDTVLHVVERFQSTRVAMAVISDRSGNLTGVVTATDLLHTLIGEPSRPETG